jgi:hypothetical protein
MGATKRPAIIGRCDSTSFFFSYFFVFRLDFFFAGGGGGGGGGGAAAINTLITLTGGRLESAVKNGPITAMKRIMTCKTTETGKVIHRLRAFFFASDSISESSNIITSL